MIHENIRAARKAKGVSQEELAVRLNVVRQTVSKWENGLSVPDADVLIRMAQLLDVPVSRLLGVESGQDTGQDLAEQLARLNEELADRARRERLTQRVNEKRGIILFLSFVSLAAALGMESGVVPILLFGGCVLAALVVFYRNLALLTGPAATSSQLWAVRAATVFNFIAVAALFAVVGLHQSGVVTLSDEAAQALLMGFITVFMLFTGFISPKLPFNRYTGLRLPWTVRDEDAWNVAHKILGYLSLPLALLYLAACWVARDTENGLGAATLCVMLLWVGIPGALSLVFFWKKVHGKL